MCILRVQIAFVGSYIMKIFEIKYKTTMNISQVQCLMSTELRILCFQENMIFSRLDHFQRNYLRKSHQWELETNLMLHFQTYKEW
jgi:hypothetical protein